MLPDKYNPVYQKASPRKKVRIERAWIISSMLNEGRSVASIAKDLNLSIVRVKNLAFEHGLETNPQGGGVSVRIMSNIAVAASLRAFAAQSNLPISTIASRIVAVAVSDKPFFAKNFSKTVLGAKASKVVTARKPKSERKKARLSPSKDLAFSIASEKVAAFWGNK